MTEHTQTSARRTFLSRLGIGAAAVAAGAALPARAQTAGRTFQPAVHPQDDWFDQAKGSHRFVLDTTTPPAAGSALLYTNNFLVANKSGYNLEPADLAVVIVMRHFSTPFAYNDAVWAKYGTPISETIGFTDPKTKQAPSTNLYNVPGYGFALNNFGTTLDSVIQRGVRFAVCDLATHFYASMLADKTKGSEDAIYKELLANFIGNAHLVPAGIVAVNRAQERGYTFSYVA